MDSRNSENTESSQYPMSIRLMGTSFRQLTVDERETLSAAHQKDTALLKDIKSSLKAHEAAFLSTCNRFEILTVRSALAKTESDNEQKSDLINLLKKKVGKDFKADDFYLLHDRDAIRHIFRVAASLDSMVVGEAQVLGQVKDCYRRAVEEGCAGRYLHHLFQFAFRLAKKVRNNTSVADKGVSISYIAVRLAQQIFGELKGRSVLVIGSGQMAELAAVHLKSYGCSNIIVANRTLERAFELANKIGGSAISLSEIEQHLQRVDVVIGSIAAVDKPLIQIAAMKKIKRSKPIFLLDLGVPRNFTPALGEIDDVYLYNIDDLSSIAAEHKELRAEAAKEAEVIIDYGLLQFEKWLAKVAAEPAILDFRAKVRSACKEELESMIAQYLPVQQREEVLAEISYKISQKISHDITNLLARLPDGKIDQESILPLLFDEYLKLV